MNYLKIYNQLISKRRLYPYPKDISGSREKHHVIPKSMGGDNSKENLVWLSAKEHFIAHRLLAKINPNSKVAYAVWLMACFNKKNIKFIVTSRTYEKLRLEHAARVSNNPKVRDAASYNNRGKKQSSEHIAARVESRKKNGAWHSEETKLSIGRSKKGKPSPLKGIPSSKEDHLKGVEIRRAKGSYTWSESQREKMSKIVRNKGEPKSPEFIEKMKMSFKKRPNVKCPHCEVKSTSLIMGRWHFKNCKFNTEIQK